ncbi:MAG: lysylphosphatidylglycerol synthase transmembrane domain-containing protein [Bacillota bacterium]
MAIRVEPRTAISYVLLAVGICVLVLFIRTVEIDLVLSSLRDAGVLPLVAAVAASLLNICIKAWRWHWMIVRVGSVRMSAGASIGSIYAGVASASLVPGKIVDFAKPLIAKGSCDVPLTQSTTAMLVERVVDTLSVALIFLVSLPFIPGIKGTVVQTAVLPFAAASVLIILLALVFRQRFSTLLKALISRLPQDKRFVATLTSVVDRALNSLAASVDRSGLVVLLAFSLVSMVLEVARFYLVFLSIGIQINWFAVALLYTASILVSFVSLVPGGVGVTEAFQAASLGLLLQDGSAREVAKGAVLLDRVISYYAVVAIGAVILVLYQRWHLAAQRQQ